MTRCLRRRCGRKLTSRASQEAGYGPRCRHLLSQVAIQLTGRFHGWQIEKAATALRNGCYQLQEPGLYLVKSATTDETYMTTCDSCTCPAGYHERKCYHLIGVLISEA